MFFLILVSVLAENINCIPPGCSNCASGVLVGYQCLDKCPLPSSASQIPCEFWSYEVFYHKFNSRVSFNSFQLGDFSTPNSLPFSSTTKTGPIPTFNQGFYFASNSSLIYSTSNYYNSNFNFDLAGIFKRPGNLFRIIDGNITYIRIYTTVDKIFCEFLLHNQTSTIIWSKSISLSTSSWDAFTFSFYHKSDFSIQIRIRNRNFLTDYNVPNFEYRSFTDSAILIYGSQNSDGFEGFLLEARYRANYSPYFNYYSSALTCFYDYKEYCNGDIVVSCNSSCPDWPWCIDSSCNACYSKYCASCDGYNYLDCTQCNNNKIAPSCSCWRYCETCESTFSCTKCLDGYALIGKICILTPYGIINETLNVAVFEYIFDSYEQYKSGIFQSGSNPDTYYPYNHEYDDPWILDQRGSYMNQHKFFQTKTGVNLNLNYEFAVGVWVLTGNKVLIDFGNFQVETLGRCSIIFTGVDKLISENIGITNPIHAFWMFYSVRAKFNNEITTLSIINGDRGEDLYSIEGFIYSSLGSSVKISSTEDYFLYSLIIFQTCTIVDGNYLKEDTRIVCSPNQYSNSYINKCMTCSNSSSGCVSFGSYGYCKLQGCLECEGYSSNCTETSTSNCIVGTNLTSSNCCDLSCSDCFNSNNFSCFSCSSMHQYLIGHACVDICPDGFEGIDNFCKEVDSTRVHIVFDKYLFNFTDLTGNAQVLAGDSVTVYPDILDSQPIPTYKRGFYFRSNSYVTIPDIRLSYNITFLFMIKGINDGVLLTKGKIKIQIGTIGLNILDTTTGFGAYFGFTRDVWQIAVVKMYGRIDSTEATSIVINSGTEWTILTPNIVFESEKSEITLGSPDSTFTGFLYEFKLINKLSVASNTLELCINQITPTCILDCSIDKYFSNGQCFPCINCPYSCINDASCSLCEDPLCNKCSSYDSICSICNPNSLLTENICKCVEGYYHNLNTNTCDKCLNNCLACTSLNDCSCFENSHNNELFCECDFGYFKNDYQSCILCYETCNECFGLEYYKCLGCNQGFYLLNSVCISQCPVGFKVVNGKCEGKEISVNFKFDRLDGKFFDSVSGVEGKVGKGSLFYPLIDTYDPWPIYNRGLYFNNSIFMFPEQDDIFVLPVEFSFGLWIRPQTLSGYMVYESNGKSPTFTILLSSELVELSFFTDSLRLITLESNIETETWGFLMISSKYSNSFSISLSYNNWISSWISFGPDPIIDNVENKFRIGSNPEMTQSYSGFLYEILVFTVVQDPKNLLSSDCPDCDYCFNSQGCINNCSLLEYYAQNVCKPCESICEKGCRTSDSCNLCSDINCLYCETYTSLCTECFPEFQLLNGKCAPICESFEYLDFDSNTCKYCQSLCISCTSAFYCNECVINAFIASDYTCKCLKGFHKISNSCVRKYFSASLGVKFNNDIIIRFTERLNENLKITDLNLIISNQSFEFNLKFIDKFSYKINLVLNSDIQTNTKVMVKILKETTSINNSLLANYYLTAQLYEYKVPEESKEILRLESATYTGMIVGIGTSMIISIINYDLRGFLNFRNSAEIFAVVALFNIPFEEKESAFLLKIHYSSKLPSFIDSIVEAEKGIKLSKNLRKFGYNTNLMLLNSGMFFITCLIFLISYSSIKILTRLKNIGILNKMLSYLEFDAFLTLWLQSYLEVSVCSIISIKNTKFENETQIIDIFLSILSLIFNLIGTVFLIFLIRKHNQITDSDEKSEFTLKFATFFNEFQKNSLCLFYAIYVGRRLMFLILYLFVESFVLQIVFFSVFSIWNFLYMIVSKCHLDRFNQIFLVLSEGLTFTVFWLILLKYGFEVRFSSFTIISLISFALISNSFIGICKLALKIYNFVKNRKNKVIPYSEDTTIKTNYWMKRENKLN